MNDLREVTKEPEFLQKSGYNRRDEETTDSARFVWYEKTFGSIVSQLRFIIQVEFELFLYDDPFASYIENCCYSFNGVYLKVIDRQMERCDNLSYDEDTELPREIDRCELNIHTFSRLRSFSNMLESR
ncbi:MAG: hypothetical protein AABY87_12790 [bacterium]|mgnify:CR=1 FL=1